MTDYTPLETEIRQLQRERLGAEQRLRDASLKEKRVQDPESFYRNRNLNSSNNNNVNANANTNAATARGSYLKRSRDHESTNVATATSVASSESRSMKDDEGVDTSESSIKRARYESSADTTGTDNRLRSTSLRSSGPSSSVSLSENSNSATQSGQSFAVSSVIQSDDNAERSKAPQESDQSEAKQRNKRVFGMLMGTLKQFKSQSERQSEAVGGRQTKELTEID
jgi:hypothetical protein